MPDLELSSAIGGRVLCLAAAARCVCTLEKGHAEPHACYETGQRGGQWTGSQDDGTFRVVKLPRGGIFADMFASLLGGLFDGIIERDGDDG